MRPAARLLLASLAVNATLLLGFLDEPRLLPSVARDVFSHRSAVAARSVANAPETTPAIAAHFWHSLDSNDLPTFVRNLQAAGFPDTMVRELARGRIQAIVTARAQAEARLAADAPFWKPAPVTLGSGDTSAFYTERSRLFHELFPPEPSDARRPLPRPLGELPPSKTEAIARIDRDYDEMRQKIRSASKGVELAADRAQEVLLQRARRADIVAALTPKELEVYDLNRWPMTRHVTHSLSLMNGTEDEFVKIFRIYRPFAEILEPFVRSPESAQNRTEAERQIAGQLKAALGESRYADYVRSSNSEFRDLDGLAARADIPTETAIDVFHLRSGAAAESKRIYDDPNQSGPQKRVALQALAGEIQTRIATMLGPTAADDYIEMNGWVRQIERGGAIELDANGNVRAWLLLPPNSATPSKE